MSRHKNKPRFKKLRSMYIWHRYVGISAAILVLILAISGLMLNHTGELKLDSQYIKSNLLLDYYGIRAPKKIHSYPVDKHWLSQWGERLFLDQLDLGTSKETLLGVLFYENMFVLALESEVWLLSPEGELIEKLGGNEGIPAGMSAIGLSDEGHVAVMAAHGVYTADRDLVIWQDAPEAITVWVDSAELPPGLAQILLEEYRGHGLSLERVALDLHSGRLFGQYGIYVMDAAAILMLFLALSGSWIWGIRHIRNKLRKKSSP
ncbi:hypothetical protein MNBD_GAMMA25-77 [hydrothermal vent metagenome]|uniref:PepSY domain-containing protein n=1 Tax=hydrothermal vent metagenome TaxID=652676 RepID=A0A3B1C087_9ZZZZ